MTENSPKRSAPADKIKHSVIVAHPDLDSFTMAVATTYRSAVEECGQQVVMRDLYRLGFDPVLKSSERPSSQAFVPQPDVAHELGLLGGSDIFVLIYPIWFGTPPAMIKGYVERVLGAGINPRALTQHLGGQTNPLLGGKHLLSFTSSGSSLQWLSEQGAWNSLQTIFDGYLARAFWMDTPQHIHFEAIVDGLDKTAVDANLRKVEAEARLVCDRLRQSRDTAENAVAPETS
jgi:NAD(P)H dehydrogenase (quinone)